jgi:hypothetical protein
MKIFTVSLSFLLAALLMAGCTSLVENIVGAKTITPSNTMVTEDRDVSGFTGIDMRTLGKLVITQGDSESLTITGSDNLVPLVKTTVRNGVLVIEMNEKINPLKTSDASKALTFTISLKDMDSLMVSGLAEVEMGALSTSKLVIDMSGAGHIQLSDLTADQVELNFSGLGGAEISGEATSESIKLSGAGNIQAGDFKCQTANVTLSGLGSATVWVTDELTGEISGGGSVKYYGDPQTNTKSTGLGKFESLGSK